MPSELHLKKRGSYGSLSLKTISAAVISALVFSTAHAAGLGKLTVLSPLGQPLRAEIELTSVSKDEMGALTAKLASVEAFRQASIDFHPMLMSLRFAIEQRGSRQIIRVTSTEPINEPFVDLLLELSGPHGRLVREYTFLLDPADLRTSQSAQVAPVPVPSATTRQVAPFSSSTGAVPQARTATGAVPPMAGNAAGARNGRNVPARTERYLVRRGDTLHSIASRLKPEGISLDQMLVALYRTNPDAFAGENMNRLMAGRILTVPTADAAASTSAQEARGVIVAQAADFNSYRSKLARQVEAAAARPAAEPKQGAGGKITARVEEAPSPASESKDKLKLSNAVPGGAGTPASVEDGIARDKALAEAQARLVELERNVSELQELLEIKNKSLAELQQQANAQRPTSSTAPSAATAEAPPAASSAAAPTLPGPASPPSQAEPSAPESPAPESPAQQAPSVAESAPVAPLDPKPEKPVSPPPPVASAEPDFVDSLLENPMVLPGLGALLAALGVLGIYRARRRKHDKHFDDTLLTESSLKANSLFGSTGGQNVDTSNSVFNSGFTTSANQLDSNEVDPVAEADVYIAYGRDAQAEEILKEALRTHPARLAVPLKLLEIYSNRKDVQAFSSLARELHTQTGGQGEEWELAATMGAAIDPDNPLYILDKSAEPMASDVQDLQERQEEGAQPAPVQPAEQPGLATLRTDAGQGSGSPDLDKGSESDVAYDGNPGGDAEKPLELDANSGADRQPEAEVEKASSSRNDLDFDLDGMDFPGVNVPDTMPRPVPAEPSAQLASIDFNFLDEPTPASPAEIAEEVQSSGSENVIAGSMEPPITPDHDLQDQGRIPEIPSLVEPEFSHQVAAPAAEQQVESTVSDGEPAPADIPPLEFDIPDLPELSQDAQSESKPDSPAGDTLDFDLSSISLELDAPQETEPLLDLGQGMADVPSFNDDISSSSAEMATKLDLAIAYQEIGDKEGARELLDEVLKGGTPEQSDRAKALLHELA